MTDMHIHGGDVYRHPDVVDFSVNLNPLGPPPGVTEAVRESAAFIARYPDARKEELTRLLAARENVPAEELIFGNGAAELIFLWAEAVRPHRAVLAAPCFAEYVRALRAAGCDDIVMHMRGIENGFRLTEKILDKLTEDTDALILCNPENPTGLLADPGLMEDIIRRCAANGISLMVDECFLALCDVGEDRSVRKYMETNHNIFLLNAFTKTCAMAGLRLGYGMTCDRALLERMQSLCQPWNVSIPAQMAGVAALRTDPSYLTRSRQVIGKERAYLLGELNRIGLWTSEAMANYILFRVPEGKNGGFEGRLLREGILIRDCSNYTGLGPGYFRVAVRLHEDNVKLISALRRLLI